MRCNPWDVSFLDYCAAERDNPALTCIPLTQARIAAISTYYGPADTCEGYIPSVPAPWSETFGGCYFSGDLNGAPLERSGSCPTQSGTLYLANRGITSVKNYSFAGMGACT